MIELSGISKTFLKGTPNEVTALAGINLNVTDGEWVTIVGSNGAGKSTLLHSLAGLVEIDTGKIVVAGHRVDVLAEHKRARFAGRIDQDPAASTAPQLSVEENMSIASMRGARRTLRRAVTERRRQMFTGLLVEVGMGLEDRLKTEVSTLSGGQRQALALIMATMTKPELLLLDEHVAALDPRAAVEVMSLTERLVRTHSLTTVMVTHNMEHAVRYGDRLIMMHRGSTVLEVDGEEKRAMSVPELISRFHGVDKGAALEDRTLLEPTVGEIDG